VSDEQAAELIAKYEKAVEEREHYRELYLQTLEQCRKLEQGIVGPKSERLAGDEAQLTMAVLATLLGKRDEAAPSPSVEQPVREHTREKPTGRKSLPDNLPRVDVEILPDEVKR
jgi:hypothetical protein